MHHRSSDTGRNSPKSESLSQIDVQECDVVRVTPTLPGERSSFFGRTRELEALTELFESGTRLVTVVGPPGIGKTRLSLRFAWTVAPTRPAVFVDLTEARSGAAVCLEIGRQLQVRFSEEDSLESMVAHLADQFGESDDLLLILDNFEHLVDIAPQTLSTWLDRCPAIRFLVTSRHALRIRGEHLLELPTLPVPSNPGGDHTAALELFVDRAKEVEPSFALTGATAETVVRLVQRLEGHALAIELAAAQLSWATPMEILRSVSSQLLEFRSLHQDSVDRHVSLQAAVDISWALLSPTEQAAVCQISVFRGGFDTQAAERVLRFATLGSVASVAKVIAGLRGKSFLRRNIEANETTRWSLALVLREYVRAHADRTGGVEEAEARHAHYFLLVGDGLRSAVGTSAEPAARVAVRRDLDNLEHAFEWFCMRADRPEYGNAALRLGLALECMIGPWMPARALELLTRVLLVAPAQAERTFRSKALLARARLARSVGRYTEARTDLDTLRSSRSDDPSMAAQVELEAGLLHSELGQANKARTLLSSCLVMASKSGDKHVEAKAEMHLGHVLRDAFRQYEEPATRCRRGVRLAVEAGDPHLEARARVLVESGESLYKAHVDLAELADLIATAHRFDDPWLEIQALLAHGFGLVNQRAPEDAVEIFRQAKRVARRAGLGYLAICALHNEASALDLSGQVGLALERHTEALQRCETLGALRLGALTHAHMAGIFARTEDLSSASRSLRAGEVTFRHLGDVWFPLLTELQNGQLELVRARLASDTESASSLRQRAQARLEASVDAGSPQNLLSLETCLEMRMLHELLARELRRTDGDRDAVLAVPADGTGFRLGDGAWTDLSRSHVAQRVLLALVEHRMRRPGTYLSAEDLFCAAWPGQRIQKDARSMRVRNTIHRLREMGLAPVLRKNRAGYRLDPMLNVKRTR